jgi:hypothetical protein
VIASWWAWYWQQTGGNVLAMPLCGLLAVAFAVCCRKPIARWWHRYFGAKAELADIKATVDAAHKIAADLFEHHTGSAHPLAPGRQEGS